MQDLTPICSGGIELGRGRGKSKALRLLTGFNNIAMSGPAVAAIDLDHDFHCAPDAKAAWLPHPNQWMCLRIPVREIEAWLLADREAFSEYFKIARTKLPTEVESLDDPKRKLVDLIRSFSTSKDIRQDIVPRAGSGTSTGAGYSGRIRDFVSGAHSKWRPEVAATNCDSLARAIRSFTDLRVRYEHFLNGN